MEYKNFFNDEKIPSIGLGTWTIGGRRDVDYKNDKESVEAIKNAIRLGYTHIDTAEVYGLGHCEEIVGEAIKEFDRNKLFITTKVVKTNLRYENVILAFKNSLRRLGVNYIDLYLIHSHNEEISIKETMRAMDYLVEQKLTRFIGVSNFTVEQIKEAQKFSKNKIVANQIEYNLITRNGGHTSQKMKMEEEVIPYCQENDIIVIAYRPLERGLLVKEHPILDKLALKYNKTRTQIAINWLISKKGIITIPKSTNIKHLQENLGAMGWKMEKEDYEILDDAKFEGCE